MGSGVSGLPGLKSTHAAITRSTNEIAGLLMPVYFLDDDPTPEDVEIASMKWNLIIDDKSTHFHRKKGMPGYHQASCIMLFYDSFYQRLFDIHPVSLKLLYHKLISLTYNLLLICIMISIDG